MKSLDHNVFSGRLSERRLRAQVNAIVGRNSYQRSSMRLPNSFSPIGEKYQLIDEIGQGMRGTVYLAKHRQNDSLVAIKVLNGCRDRNSRLRFRREAFCAASLKHPNIVAVHDFIGNREVDAIIMEYVPGKTLDRLIPAGGLPLTTCLRYARQIACALSVIHSSLMIYRDLKPTNIIVTRNGVVKLLDFGLAKKTPLPGFNETTHAALSLTIDGTIMGTIGYMSPEQILGKADARSDVFSFGALFYEMLTGSRAYELSDLIRASTPSPASWLPKLPQDIPYSLRRIIWRCLAKNPDDRYQTGIEIFDEIEVVIPSLNSKNGE